MGQAHHLEQNKCVADFRVFLFCECVAFPNDAHRHRIPTDRDPLSRVDIAQGKLSLATQAECRIGWDRAYRGLDTPNHIHSI
jgi:hypothetical protein